MLIWIGRQKGLLGLPGIPARNLSDDEVEKHGGESRLLATGLWERPPEPEIEESDDDEQTGDFEPVED